jgi:hypothetical protein
VTCDTCGGLVKRITYQKAWDRLQTAMANFEDEPEPVCFMPTDEEYAAAMREIDVLLKENPEPGSVGADRLEHLSIGAWVYEETHPDHTMKRFEDFVADDAATSIESFDFRPLLRERGLLIRWLQRAYTKIAELESAYEVGYAKALADIHTFNEYIGARVGLTVEDYEQEIMGCMHQLTNYEVKPDDPTMLAITKLAEEKGFTVRVWTPEKVGFGSDVDCKRLNIHLDEHGYSGSGRYCVHSILLG